jgi:hypothetical protein
MANIKFEDLIEVTGLNPTDLFAISLNGAGSRKIKNENIIKNISTPNQQVYYWGKHGNDSNTGKNWDNNAFLTLGKAISEASLQSPSPTNQFTLVCKDSGIYTEQVVLPAWVSIYAPNATLTSTSGTGHTLEVGAVSQSSIKLHEVESNSSDATISVNALEFVYLDIDNVDNTSTGHGLEILDGNAFGYIKWLKKLYVGASGALGLKVDFLLGNIDLINGSIGALLIGRHFSGTLTKGTTSTIAVEILNPFVLKTGDGTIDPILSYSSHPTFTADTQLVDKKYVDDSDGAGAVDNLQIYYVGKHGSDSNSGKNWNEAFLTFGKAITEIATQSPTITNQFSINCKDSGIYDEQITIAAFTNVDAPNAILKSTNSTGHTLEIDGAQENIINLHEIRAESSDAAVHCDPESTSHVFLKINSIINTGSGVGIECVDGYTVGNINYCQKFYCGTNGEIELTLNSLTGNITLIGGSTGSLKIGRLISGTIDKQTGSTVSIHLIVPSSSTFYNDLKVVDQAIIGGTTINSSAQFQIDSTTKGFLPPRMSTSQRNAISSPDTGLHVYDTDEDCLYFYNGSAWKSVCAAAQTIDTFGAAWAQATGTYSPSFTLEYPPNRIVIIGIATDNTTPNASWSDVKYAGVSMRHIPGAYLSWGNNSMDFYFMLEQDLIGITDGSPHSVTVTFINTPAVSNIGFVFGVYKNVNQTNPFETIHTAADMSTNPLSVNIQNCSIDDHVVGLGFDDFDTGTFTVSAPFSEHPRATFTTARLAFADAVATTTTTTCQYTSSSGPGLGIIGFGLRGIGK